MTLTRGATDAFDPGLRASGPGWLCAPGAGVCTYTGVVPSDGDSAPLEVLAPNRGAPGGPSLIARVTGGGDAGDEGVGPWT